MVYNIQLKYYTNHYSSKIDNYVWSTLQTNILN